MKYFRTGKIEIDKQIDAFIEFSKTFLEIDVVSIYLLGSYIDNSAIKNSDLDIAIIYKKENKLKVDEISSFFFRFSRDLFRKEIDLYLVSLNQIDQLDHGQLLTREAIINIKISSVLIYGQDIKNKIRMPNFETYLESTLKIPFYFMAKVRGYNNPSLIEESITFPNSKDYFYGYLSHVKDTHKTLESKPILSLIGWICTSLLAIKARQLIGKKSDVCRAYELYINDEWTPYVKKAYQLIRHDLEYQLPKIERDKKGLRIICSKLIHFENYFIKEYGKFTSQKKQKNK